MKNLVIKYLLFFLVILFIWGCKDDVVSVDDSKFPLAGENGIDAEKLEAVYEKAKYLTGIKCLLVSRDGNLVSEEYYNFSAENLKEVRSVTKSVLSSLIGIAIDKGFISNVDQTIEPYFKDYEKYMDSVRNSITVRDLLTMSCGLSPNEFSSVNSTAYGKWYNSNDKIQNYLEKTMISKPGEEFRYFSGCTHLLSKVLTEASGMSTFDFAKKYLFEPLEIDTVNWRFLGNLDNPEVGYYHGGAGLEIKPRDLMKFGELFLNNGVYKGNQIVPATWVNESTKFQISVNGIMPYSNGYGYLWWLGRQNNYNYFFANGWGGQIVMCVPRYNLVVVATHSWGGLTGTQASGQWTKIMSLIMNELMLAVN